MILYEIKKSKFFGYAFFVKSVEEAHEKLEELKKEHKKATHICWAYVFENMGVMQTKWSDDGEPTGTAGRPIASVIEKKNAKNIVVFVVRYFGGVKLGTGGLVRAYTKATSQAIDECK